MTCRFSLLGCCYVAAVLALVASAAHGEGAAREHAPNQVALAQSLTIAELEGTKIQFKLVTEMLAQREGGPRGPVTNEADWNVVVEPGANISWTYRPTAHTPRGTRAGQKIASTAALDQAWHTPNGEAVWQFTEGKLVFLRSYKGGAVRTIIAFMRDGPNLTCAASSVFARERGRNNLVMNSPIDGAPVTIFSWKSVSSSCDITR